MMIAHGIATALLLAFAFTVGRRPDQTLGHAGRLGLVMTGFVAMGLGLDSSGPDQATSGKFVVGVGAVVIGLVLAWRVNGGAGKAREPES